MSPRCPDCGRPEPADARFCSACGTRMLPAADEVTDAFDPVEEIPHEEDRGRFPVECGLFVVESDPRPVPATAWRPRSRRSDATEPPTSSLTT